ncbi:hypothetical protein [Streptomyces violascens]|uniref:hypothetical protein n=1 Tax=Streptomyces violascens TaxID=67381 RepID=UPI001CFD0BC8|nr:hypothetical protein [Streptomyces violascens]
MPVRPEAICAHHVWTVRASRGWSSRATARPAVWTQVDGSRQLVAFDVRTDGLIHGIFAVLNP